MKVRIVIFVICIQALFITLLSIATYEKFKESTLGVSVNPLNKSSLTVSQDGELKYFYEPKADTTEEVDLSWLGEEYKYKVYYDINSDTLNQHGSLTVEKPAGTFRIVTLGDSFTFGVNVDTAENYPSKLQLLLDTQCKEDANFEVINLGVGGYDFQYAINRLQKRGIKYDPDIVVWLIVGDNFLRFNELLIPLSTRYAQEMKESGEYDRLVRAGTPYPSWNKARDEIIDSLGGEDQILSFQKQRLESIFNFFDREVVFSTIENYPSRYSEIIDSVTSKNKNAYSAILSDIYKKRVYLPDYHPNKEGYQNIANDIFQYIKKEKLIPCI